MKKILSLITISLVFIWVIPVKASAMTNTGYFVVTAYYSPLPNQKHYLTGDYESEKRLNWQWIRWASWKSVFSGMLAWPKTYAFWTKIYLEWLGIWEISDRWWAIVTAWNRWYTHDRIDVWMWYWDEWLQRALYWWKRTIKWNIIDTNSIVNLNYEKIPSPAWASSWLKPQNDVFTYSLWVGSDVEKVRKLQSFFSDLWLYKWDVNWIYNSEIIDIVYDFQVQNEIVTLPNQSWAGYWWNLTKDKFKKAYLNWDFDKVETDKSVIEVENEVIKTKEKSEDNYDIFAQIISWTENIKQLQLILKEISFYTWEITWNYDDIKDSIYTFQVENYIVKSEKDLWAWNFWPKTREALKTVYTSYSLEKEKAVKLLQEEEKRKQELEDKYREIEKSIIETVEKKTKDLLWIKFWEVSPRVRNFQLTLKELGYFNEKDTAIYWDKTKESLAIFQLDNNLIDTIDSQYAWVLWERTLGVLKDKLEEKYLQSKLEWNDELLEFASLITYNSL